MTPNATPTIIQALGFAAASLTTAAFVPQLVRVLRLRSARDISLPTFLMFSLGVALWIVYGLLARSNPVVVANAVTLVLSLSILVLKLRFDRLDPPQATAVAGDTSQRSSSTAGPL